MDRISVPAQLWCENRFSLLLNMITNVTLSKNLSFNSFFFQGFFSSSNMCWNNFFRGPASCISLSNMRYILYLQLSQEIKEINLSLHSSESEWRNKKRVISLSISLILINWEMKILKCNWDFPLALDRSSSWQEF